MTVLDLPVAAEDLLDEALGDLPTPRRGPHGWPSRGRCATGERADSWTDLPPLRIKGQRNPAYAEHKAALARVCATCPVQAACLSDALGTDVVGYWAGTDEFDRHDLRQALDLPDPEPLRLGPLPDADNPEADRLRFQVRYLATKTDLTNNAIAKRVGVSPMTVTRILDEREPDQIPSRTRRSA